MKPTRKPGICEVRIHGKGKLPHREPKICEVKIFGGETRNKKNRTVGVLITTTGMNQIVAQVANRLSHRTRSFKDGGGAQLTLPEWGAIKKMPSVFKILLTQKIHQLAPQLRHEECSLTLIETFILFIPGARDF